MLTDTFLKLTSKYNPDKSLANDLWLEIFTKYSDPKRHYHTITHLENMMAHLTAIESQVQDWETTLFALYYHDIVYKATSNTNEEDSAKLARQKLIQIGYPEDKINTCCEMIIATKLHNFSTHNDTNLLVDADLAILGQKPDVYQQYAEDVRKEYAVYPDFLYNRGRKKALQHFLEMESIFKTNYFIGKYEKQARLNIANELADIAT